MPRNDSHWRWSTSLTVSLGPLQWQRNSQEECVAEPGPLTRQQFKARLYALMQQALRDGCAHQDLDNILRQLSSGDLYGDA